MKFFLHSFRRFLKLRNLIQSNYTINFSNEGGIKIKLPKLSYFEVFFNYGIRVKRNFLFINRPNKEPLMRRIVYELFSKNFLNKAKSIIDIGSWIGDNSVIWAKLLDKKSIVFAIDPSKDNQSYCKILSRLNKIENINWINAVCSQKINEKLGLDGTIDHAVFKYNFDSVYFLSKTLDQIIFDNSSIKNISFMHIDVEGFELKVLKGAKNIIRENHPTIIFEQHISKDNVSEMFKYLQNFGYEIYMINEVLPGCELDCRNFIAFNKMKNLPDFNSLNKLDEKSVVFKRATIGPVLIKISNDI